ncbi:MAG: M56 family metallopeptidase [Caulobacterales bacterium]|jgi:beta-lactamase regulating signal transducer with metallopeptidase domain
MQQLLAGYVLNAAWQAPVVALCALAISRFAGLSPAARNNLWLSFLGAAAVLPAISLGAILPRATPTVARVPADGLLDAAAVAPLHAVPASAPAVVLAPWSAWVMAALVILAASALTVRLLLAAAAARRLVRDSRPVALASEVAQAVERFARAHDRAVPPIRRSWRVSSPAVVGALRPVILIPDGMAPHGEDLRAALLHEMAHVVRHDYAINLAGELLTLPVCWHPALLVLKAGVRRSRELACDALAARAMASPRTYARCLVSLAQTLGAPPLVGAGAPASTALAVGLFGRSDLEDRLMQLMKPLDAEAPVLRAARLCGLAALGAGLLGSAALLHVTPVFAQAAPRPVAPAASAAPATPATTAIAQAQHDAARPVAAHRRRRLIYSDKGVVLEVGHTGYRHSFTAADGEPITVVSDEAAEPSAEQQRQWEAEARDAEAKAAAAEARINSPEFKARIARATAAGEAAQRRVNAPEFKARITAARAAAAAAEARINSPEFKARIAQAQARAAEAQRMVDAPEFKARIARAQADAEAARAMVASPEFQARMARLRDLSAQIGREFDEPGARDQPPGRATP